MHSLELIEILERLADCDAVNVFIIWTARACILWSGRSWQTGVGWRIHLVAHQNSDLRCCRELKDGRKPWRVTDHITEMILALRSTQRYSVIDTDGMHKTFRDHLIRNVSVCLSILMFICLCSVTTLSQWGLRWISSLFLEYWARDGNTL